MFTRETGTQYGTHREGGPDRSVRSTRVNPQVVQHCRARSQAIDISQNCHPEEALSRRRKTTCATGAQVVQRLPGTLASHRHITELPPGGGTFLEEEAAARASVRANLRQRRKAPHARSAGMSTAVLLPITRGGWQAMKVTPRMPGASLVLYRGSLLGSLSEAASNMVLSTTTWTLVLR